MSEPDALQTCLAAEHAAVFGYGVLGGVLAGTSPSTVQMTLADASYAVHRDRRDTLVAMITELGPDPVAAAAVYDVSRPTDRADCTALAQELERRTAAVYAYAVAFTTGERRRFASTSLVDCAVRGVEWGAPSAPLPGIEPSP